jgi:hypothetical protein
MRRTAPPQRQTRRPGVAVMLPREGRRGPILLRDFSQSRECVGLRLALSADEHDAPADSMIARRRPGVTQAACGAAPGQPIHCPVEPVGRGSRINSGAMRTPGGRSATGSPWNAPADVRGRRADQHEAEQQLPRVRTAPAHAGQADSHGVSSLWRTTASVPRELPQDLSVGPLRTTNRWPVVALLAKRW